MMGTTSNVQGQLNNHNTSINALLDVVITRDNILGASIGYAYDHNMDTIRMPKDYTAINAKCIVVGSLNICGSQRKRFDLDQGASGYTHVFGVVDCSSE